MDQDINTYFHARRQQYLTRLHNNQTNKSTEGKSGHSTDKSYQATHSTGLVPQIKHFEVILASFPVKTF